MPAQSVERAFFSPTPIAIHDDGNMLRHSVLVEQKRIEPRWRVGINLCYRLSKHHTIILSSHILSEIQAVCKRILIINNGEIVADDMAVNLSHNLSNNHTIHLRAQGPEAEVKKLIDSIKGVKSITSLGVIEPGSMDYEIEPAEDTDIRKEIFSRMSDRKWTILELNSNELTLEQIFLRLTDGSYENKKIIDQKEEKLSASDKEAAFEAAFGEEEK